LDEHPRGGRRTLGVMSSDLEDALDAATSNLPSDLGEALSSVGSGRPGCPGRLVIHPDGSVWHCSEEDGGTCPGYDLDHARGQMPCFLASETGTCPICGAGGD
jgi:hypothetical protein